MRYRPILCVLGVVLALGLSGCAILDGAFGVQSDGSDGIGWLDKLVQPVQSVPGPIGFGADILILVGGLYAAFRGKRWKDLAVDGVALIKKLRESPEGEALWAKIKPRFEEAKSRKNMKKILVIFKEIKSFLKEQDGV